MASILEDVAVKRSLILRLAAGVSWSGLAVVLLSVAVVILAMRDTHDWFIPPTGPGFLRAGELADLYVQNEASQMVMLQNNWTAETLPKVQEVFQRLLDPSLRKAYETKTALDERKVVKEAKIALAQFVVTGVDILRKQGDRRRVLVHGVRSLYIGSTVSAEEVTIDMGLEPDYATGRPTGLKIMSLVPSRPLKLATP